MSIKDKEQSRYKNVVILKKRPLKNFNPKNMNRLDLPIADLVCSEFNITAPLRKSKRHFRRIFPIFSVQFQIS